jgi:hypothetical protein
MKDRSIIGTISFPTRSACAVWRSEILGQMSDGMWENTAPGDHWVFWHRLRTVVNVGAPASVKMDEGKYAPYNQKTSYGISGLYDIIGDRMVAFGRMGRVLSTLVDIDIVESPDYDTRYGKDSTFDACVHAAEYLQEMGLDKFLEEKASGVYSKPWTERYLKAVDEETARRFFSTKYDMKDLKADVKLIKAAIKTVAANR